MKKLLLINVLLCPVLLFGQKFSVEVKDSSDNLIKAYTNIQDAYNSIPDSAADYILEIMPSYSASIENFPIVLGHRNFNKLVIRPAAGNTGCIISADVDATIINFDSCYNVEIDGRPGGTGDTADMKIENTSPLSNAYSVNIENSSSDISLKYLQVFNSTQADTFGRNISIGWSEGTGNKNITVSNCLIDGGRFGVISKGNSNHPNKNIVVSNNTIRSYGFCGVKIFYGTLSMKVSDNDIYMTKGYNVFIPVGISISGTRNAVDSVVRNKIHDIQSIAESRISMRGIYCYQAPDATVNIINNFISLSHTVPGSCNDVYGIVVMGPNDFNLNILYNTIYLAGTENGGAKGHIVSAGIMKFNSGVMANYTQLNNIIINNRTGGKTGAIHAACVLQNNSFNSQIDYNTYYCEPGDNHFMTAWDTVFYNDITQYQLAAGLETNSNYHQVKFLSDSDLHLDNSFAGDSLLIALSMSTVREDIDGETRSFRAPYRGADELMKITSTDDNNVNYLTYQLDQNYPNPFNPSTSISYTIPESGNVTIKCYDILGNEVGTLLNEFKQAGTYKITFNAKGLSSGVYLYRIDAGDFRFTRKMILLK